MKRILSIMSAALMFLFLSASLTLAQSKEEEIFFEANQAYNEGRYQEAIDQYEKLIKKGYQSGHLFYNLANGYFRLDELGEAILNYERASTLMPRDADLNFNLNHAMDLIQDAVDVQDSFISMAFFWNGSLNLAELFWIFAAINILYWGILIVRLYSRADWNYYLMIVFSVFWLITGLSFGLKYYQLNSDDRAIILESEVNVLAGPDIKDTVLFKLHEGTMVESERDEDGWSLIRISDNKRGWVLGSQAGKVKS